MAAQVLFAQQAAPIPPAPADRSGLPAPREGVVMVRVQEDGRLNVPLGGWGAQRLFHAKAEPEKFRGYIKQLKGRGLNTMRPLFHPPNAASKNDSEWAPFTWEAMDAAVAITQEEGVYFLVDYHNWMVNDTIHVDEATWLNFWGQLTERYKDYKHLIFEGYNEPQNQCQCIAEHYQKWVDLVRSKGADQLVVVSPFWGQYFGIKDPANNWAQCRHHYFHAKNSPSIERAIGEAEHHLLSTTQNKNSAPAAVKQFGCGFFMTEGGLEDSPKTEEEMAARIAGIQRMVEICEQQGYAWCLWAHGDWAKGFENYGSKIKTSIKYPSITGGALEK